MHCYWSDLACSALLTWASCWDIQKSLRRSDWMLSSYLLKQNSTHKYNYPWPLKQTLFIWILVWSLELTREMRGLRQDLAFQAMTKDKGLGLVSTDSRWVRSMEHLQLAFTSIKGYCSEMRTSCSPTLWWKPPMEWAYIFASGIQRSQKELPPERWILTIPPGTEYLGKIWILFSGDSGLNLIESQTNKQLNAESPYPFC